MSDTMEVIIERLDPIQTWAEWSKSDFYDWFTEVYDSMSYHEGEGYKSVNLQVRSTIDPYDPYPSVVEVEIWGERKKTKEEVQQDKEFDEATKLAKELGTYTKAAEEILRLKREGKL